MSMHDELEAVVDSLTPEQKAMLAELLAGAGAAPAPAMPREEPIAIVGMAGRFPGARNVAEFWSLLVDGRDAIAEIPRARWSADAFYDADKETPGKMATRWGGFLTDVDLFDAEFFGITPREAAAMDPQQRIFLETAWEALEDAGLPASALRQSATGVFVGVSNFDYMWHQFRCIENVDAYASSGSAHCIIANRISYLLDLTGPSMTVDTACSSSLVAVHLACQSLRSGECETALAGGVNLVLTPHLGVSLSRWGMMAADGRCKTFDARADGFVRGEGSGVVVLKRLSDAERAGDRVLALVRGSAVNQDGKTNGLTAPNGAAQQAVIRQALTRAGVTPAQVSFLETHGTGTSLGDPIEVEAINEVFGAHAARCVLGAVKTHIGHLEPAAGIAGLIKVVLALRHGLIPRNLHYEALNPHLTLAPGVELANETRAWASSSEPRIAGISAFSFGGTNAHVVLAEAPARAPVMSTPCASLLLPLSASHAEATRQMAVQHAELLTSADPSLALETVAGLRALHRDHLDERLVVLASERATAAEALRSFAEGRPHPDVVRGRVQSNLRPVFLYTGQGHPWLGMGRELARTEAVFRDALADADAVFQRIAGRGYAALLRGEEEESLERTDVAQPAILLLQVALTKTLEHWGIRPGAVFGHSVGEIAAAWAAGMLTLEDAVRVVHHRSRLMQRAAGKGAMASVALSPAEARAFVEPRGALAIAAHNSHRDVVLSGDPAALDDALRELEARGVRCKKLPVTYAFHSPQMDAFREELVRELSGLAPRPPQVAFYSTVTGQRERDAVATASYWARNMREPVAFADVVTRIAMESPTFFLEVGSHPALTTYVTDAVGHLEVKSIASFCMRRGQDDRRGLLAAVASLYVHGIAPDWSRLVPVPDRRWELPSYPWQRRRFWLDAGDAGETWSAPRAEGELLYETQWVPEVASNEAPRPKSYIVISDDTALADQLRAACRAAGSRCLDEGDLLHADDVLLVVPSASPASSWFDRAAQPVHALRELAQRLLDAEHRPHLTVVTRAAMHVMEHDALQAELAPLWGFGRALAIEEPGLATALIDLPAQPTEGEAQALIARLAAAAVPERQAAWRDGQWYVPRLAAYEARPTHAPNAIDPNGTYLVTGGLGSLGLATAHRLVERGVRTVALVARRAPTAEQCHAIAHLEAQGARVLTLQADVADPSDAARVLAELRASAPPLRGVFHAAGVLEDGVLARTTRDGIERVLRPKLAGAWNLHELTKDLDLGCFVLYSSATAILGAAGQTSYAAANAFLQGLAEHRRAAGKHALCIHWGAWAGSTMASEHVVAKLRALGFDTMAAGVAMDAFERAFRDDATAVTVIAADWTRYAQQLANPGLSRFLARFVDASAPVPAAEPPDPITGLLADAPPGQRSKLLYGHVRAVVLAAMGMDLRTEVRPDQGLIELGLDSLLAVNIAHRLSRDLGHRLPKTLIYDHPTLHGLSEHLLDGLFPASHTELPVVAGTSCAAIAVVGMACRFPGGCTTPEQLWTLLRDGRDAVGDAFPARWPESLFDANPDAPGKIASRGLGRLEGEADFDPEFFHVSPREAASMDPQHRLLLEVGWEACENAGLTREMLHGSRTGIFVGVGNNDYGDFELRNPELGAVSAHAGTGNATCLAAGRLSFFLGTQGPALVIDTACSSSLVAVHQACASLRQGESELAIAGGVNLVLRPNGSVFLSRFGALSPTGRCRAFAEAADGYVRAEGCGMVVLKRLDQAERDGDPIWAVIRGSAINHDGRAGGLTVPNGAAQRELLLAALKSADVAPGRIGYLEAHGTGTPLGDPIEMGAIASVFGGERAPLVVGSVKSNLGHTEAAAGIAGFIKAALCLRHGAIPAHLHFEAPSSRIDWNIPVEVPTRLRTWSSEARRMAGVSSFGFSGTNAHVILEEAPPRAPRRATREGTQLLCLSARHERSLVQLAEAHRDRLRQDPEVPIADLCHNAARRRSHHRSRLVVLGTSRDDMARALDDVIAGAPHPAAVRGEAVLDGMSKTAFVFSGQGSQWLGMGRELLEREPTFASGLRSMDAWFRDAFGWSLIDALRAPAGEGTSQLDRTRIAQPVIVAMQIALSDLWREWGVVPDATLGHSLGEITAAHIAGAIGRTEALRLACVRGRFMDEATGRGKMAELSCSEDDARRYLEGHETEVSLAAINGVSTTVLAGAVGPLEAILARAARDGVKHRLLRVDYAFHSPQMLSFKEPFERELHAIAPRAGERALYSSVLGGKVRGEELTASYWGRNLTDTVRFEPALRAMLRDGYHAIVEVAPHPVLFASIQDALRREDVTGIAAYSLRRGAPESATLLANLAALHAAGHPVDWSALYPGQADPVTLPRYPWHHRRFWTGTEVHAERDVALVPAPAKVAPLWAELTALGDLARAARLERHVREQLTRVLHLDPGLTLSKRTLLSELGMDSVGAIELAKALPLAREHDVPPTVLFEHSTIEKLTAFLVLEFARLHGVHHAPSPATTATGSVAESVLLEQLAAFEKEFA